ncbi:MAG: hypothetical protein LBN95_06910, partial [Prevotellaceae bacterium]|nr:hypothetical protein [Prevotellaceae bacterium]
MKKQFLLLLLILISAIQANGQILLFDYDESGNCVLKYRTVVVAPNGHAPAKPQTEQIGGHTLSVFPNPTYGLVRVEISGEMPEHPINVTLTDVNGK